MESIDPNRFQVLERLGAGRSGVVYLVRDLVLGGELALKALRSLTQEQLLKLTEEFSSVSELRHRNLARYHELFAHADQLSFTMEVVRGSTLLQHLRRHELNDFQPLRNALGQLAEGLSLMHRAGIVHRNLKPSNVLVTPVDRLVLLDFGPALELSPTPGATIAGAIDYVSSEQALGKPLTAASDWYSVGVMVYEALVGQRPFVGDNWLSLIDEHRRRDFPAPNELKRGIPADLSELCMSLLSGDPQKRAGVTDILRCANRDASKRPAPGTSDEENLENDNTVPLFERAVQGLDAKRFRILARLGAGGFGVVYLARDLNDGREVALKTLSATEPELIYRLKREFRSLVDLRHPNLVSLYELFGDGEQTYFTMEHISGTTFLRYVRTPNGIDYDKLREALSQLASGLSVLHAAGKLHRDVKPSNVMVSAEGRVVLLDFGLVTELTQSQFGQSKSLAGTPEYMAPERVLADSPAAPSDWYSVGVMMYQALTGVLPFRGGWPELLGKRRTSDIPSPVQLNASAPEDLSELCMALLVDDPKARAGAGEVFSALGQTPSSVKFAAAPNSILFGRQLELGQLELALARVRSEEGVTVFVEGNSGVGKTALVEHFLSWAEGTGAGIVLRGRCYEREQVPYQGIDSLLDDLCRLLQGLDAVPAESVLPVHVAALTRLFPVLERVPVVASRSSRDRLLGADQREIRRRAFGAFRELLVRISHHYHQRKLIIHIDDLQWGDVDTAGLLRDVLRQPDAPIMLLILGYRREDRNRSPCLKVLQAEPIGVEIKLFLEPLKPEAAEALVRVLAPTTNDVDVAQLVVDAGGNPLLLQEVAKFAEIGEGLAGGPGLDIRTALRSRIDRLPQNALELLQTVAVAGYPLTEQAARRAADLGSSATEAWHRLVSEHFVRFSGPPEARLVECFHDRVRETVLSSLTEQRERACHRGLAISHEEVGMADPEVLAHHHESSGNPERALELTVAAAEKATQALAFDRAARLLGHAVDALERDNPQSGDLVRLLEALGEALGNAGRCIESATAYRRAAEVAPPAARNRLLRHAADQFLFAGKIVDARTLIQDDLRAHGIRVSAAGRSSVAKLMSLRVWIWLRKQRFRTARQAEVPPETLAFLDHVRSVAMVMSFVGLPRLGAEIGMRFMLRALGLREARSVMLGDILLSAHIGARAPCSERTRAVFDKLAQEAGRFDDPVVKGTLAGIQGLHAYYRGDWQAAITQLDAAERILRDSQGRLWEIWTVRHMGIWARFFLGDWNSLTPRVLEGLRDARDRGNAYAMAGVCSPFGIVAWLSQDQPTEARQTLEEVKALSSNGFPVQAYWFLLAESLIHLYAGDGLGAWNEINLRWKGATIPGFHAQLLHIRGCCALAAAEQSSGATKPRLLAEARQVIVDLGALYARVRIPYILPLADLIRAGVASQMMEPEASAKHLDAAIAELDRQSMPVYAAAARRRSAQLLGQRVDNSFATLTLVNEEAITRMLVPGIT